MLIIEYYIIFLLSIVAHESGHFLVYRYFSNWHASKNKNAVKSILNHVSVTGTVLVPLFTMLICNFFGGLVFLIGWAKPVKIRSFSTASKKEIFLIALSGPLTNLLISAVFLLVYLLAGENISGNRSLPFVEYTVIINLCLCVINMMPVRPFDGGVIISLLDREEYRHLIQAGFLGVVAIGLLSL